jgi:hypothetical protein
LKRCWAAWKAKTKSNRLLFAEFENLLKRGPIGPRFSLCWCLFEIAFARRLSDNLVTLVRSPYPFGIVMKSVSLFAALLASTLFAAHATGNPLEALRRAATGDASADTLQRLPNDNVEGTVWEYKGVLEKGKAATDDKAEDGDSPATSAPKAKRSSRSPPVSSCHRAKK